MTFLLLGFLTAVAATACAVLYRIVRARNKRLLLAEARGIACDAPEGIGISVLCSGPCDPARIEELLTVEYARYEVVVVLDARRHPVEFEELVARYRMIRVEWKPSEEFPDVGVRTLGRSRKRCYRRLVLVDRPQDTAEGDLNAAAAVATYDYVFPLCAGMRLLPGAVERLAAELSEHPLGKVAMIRTWVGGHAVLVSREAVAAAGGFSARMLRSIPRRRRLILWEPLLCAASPRRRLPPSGVLSAALLLLGAVVVAAAAGVWPLVAVLLTAAVVWSAAACASLAVASADGGAGARLFGRLHRACKLSVKNFTMS